MTRPTVDLELSRRGLLGLMAAGSLAAVAGCQVDTGGGQAPAANATKIEFSDFSTQLPTDDVTFRWVDSGDLKSVYEKAVLDAFTAKHPNIKTQYDGSGWDTVNQVVPLGIRNKSAHDIFALPLNVPTQVAINEKWVQPIEDLIPDFGVWRKNFPETALIPGVHIFNGKVYCFPLNSLRRLDRMMFYDTANMKAAGYDDPTTHIKTWDDLYAALKKVVATGKVGFMMAGDGLAGIVRALASSIGWRGASSGAYTGMDMKTGKFAFDAPEVVQAFEFLQKLVTDKLVVPGFLTLLEKDARAQMTAGKTGMIMNGPWDIPAWKKTAPDWTYAVQKVPSAEGGDYNQPFAETGGNQAWVYSGSKLAVAAGQILSYMGSPEGQKMMVILSQGNLSSLQPAPNAAADQPGLLDLNAKICNALATKIMRACPQVELRKSDVSQVKLATKAPTPNWQDLMQGVFTGQLKDAKAQFAKYNRALEASLDEAIGVAKGKGSTVTRDDYAFANWDPTKDYTKADYDALG